MKPYKEIEMKLNRDRFEIFAKEQGYKDGVELFETLGYSADEYEYYADGEYIIFNPHFFIYSTMNPMSSKI